MTVYLMIRIEQLDIVIIITNLLLQHRSHNHKILIIISEELCEDLDCFDVSLLGAVIRTLHRNTHRL